MKILNVLPVTADVYSAEMDAYIRRYLGPDTQFDTVQIKNGAPSIECEYEEMLNAPEVVSLCKQGEKDGYDAIFINCFGDPGVRAARECVSVPVFGGFEPAVLMALGLADRVGIVTVVEHVVSMIECNISRARFNGRISSVRCVNIPVLELGDHKKMCAALIEESIASIQQDKTQAIVLGCTGMINVTEEVQAGLSKAGYDVPVIEAARAAVMTLEMYAKMGMRHSRLTYLMPPQK